MMSPYCLVLLSVLSMEGGASESSLLPLVPIPDVGLVVVPSTSSEPVRWPENLSPLDTLDGPAVLAAHSALQQVLSRFPKEAAGHCEYSARSLDVVVGYERGLYFVRIDRRVDRCGWAPGVSLEFDWFEMYAVSPEGRVVARYPSMP
ncbi:hypothetical protein MEBOL_004953 [Melittangium boletus DSM 14713]|uniref:Uncharacterized protein n=1 Tax=Melittangium boletus DSM 14713 TaxID=1294270 RepID=A0A250IJV0_9BACT|nr:hypothetical protein MEBOL_004953 [Melittangium boletus DSM 14713]